MGVVNGNPQQSIYEIRSDISREFSIVPIWSSMYEAAYGRAVGVSGCQKLIFLGFLAPDWSIPICPVGDSSDLLENFANAAGRWISPLEPLFRPCDPLFNTATIDFGGGRDVH